MIQHIRKNIIKSLNYKPGWLNKYFKERTVLMNWFAQINISISQCYSQLSQSESDPQTRRYCDIHDPCRMWKNSELWL